MTDLLSWLTDHPTALFVTIATLGLVVGSFLNVVILRLPRMLEARWRADCEAFLNAEAGSRGPAEDGPLATRPGNEAAAAPLTLSAPGSHCPQCGHPIRPWHNIPVLGWLLLRGRCADCGSRISVRYPVIELLAAAIAVATTARIGTGIFLPGALLLSWALLALSVIDIDHQLLPDDITLPLLWLGLAWHLGFETLPIADAVLGAIAGYGILWLVYHGFRLVTGKEGMGYGDFKLLAALGAWLGWQSLPMIILLSSLVGAIAGVSLMVLLGRGRDVPIPFGPYLAAAGWLYLLFGDALVDGYLSFSGFGA